MLGDQVDVLIGLLERIYLMLDWHSPILQQYFEVSCYCLIIRKCNANQHSAFSPFFANEFSRIKHFL